MLLPSFQSTGWKGLSPCGPHSGDTVPSASRGAHLQHAPEFSRTRGPSRLLFSPSCQDALMLSTLCVSCPNAALFTFFAQIVDVLATVRSFIVSRAPLTDTHARPRVFLSTWSSPRRGPRASPAPGSPWPSSREGVRPSPLEEGVGTSSSAPGPRRLLWESEVFFTHRDKGRPVEYTNHKF